MQNYEQTIISQYANSPRLLQLISNFNDVIDPTVNIDAFVSNIWDLDTAQGIGLDIWDRIVDGSGRNIPVVPVSTYLGFSEGQTTAIDYQSFGHGIFYSGPITGAYVLTDYYFRELIYARALANITNGSIPSYNRLFSLLFPTNTVHLSQNGIMNIKVNFATPPSKFDVSILIAVFPSLSPAGVQFTT